MRFVLVVCSVALLACSANNTTREDPQTAPVEQTSVEQTPVEPTPAVGTEEFVTVAELWSPNEDSLGVVVSMRETPEGNASDFVLPTGDLDPGDGRAVLFGARLIRESGSILSAAMDGPARTFELARSHLVAPVNVWLFDDANLVAVERLEPCNACAPWTSPTTKFLLVVPEGQQLSLTPLPGWTIAVSP